MNNKNELDSKRRPSGAEHKKIKELKREVDKLTAEREAEIAKRLDEKISTLSAWNNQNALGQDKFYGDSFKQLNQPVLTPDEIKSALELPIYGVAPPKLLGVINQILSSQGKGWFMPSADLCDVMLRDEKIYAFLQVRVNSLIGSKITVKPADSSDEAKEYQEEIEDLFASMMPINELGEMLRWGLLIGSSISQIEWETDADKWLPKLKVWHPKYMYYNWAMREYRLVTADRGEITILKDDIQWSIYNPYSEHLPWLRALVNPLATVYLIRSWLIQWWSRHQERNGMPIIGAITSASVDPEAERLFLQQLSNLSSNAVVRLPQGVDGNKFDLKLIQSNGDLYKGFKEYLDYVDKSIAQILLGQDKTVSTKEGLNIGGNDAGEKVRIDLQRFDAATLAEHLREKILKPYLRFNYGEDCEELAPYISFDIEEKADMLSKAQQIKTLSEAFSNLSRLEIGKQIDYRAIIDEFGLPLIESETPAIPGTADPTGESEGAGEDEEQEEEEERKGEGTSEELHQEAEQEGEQGQE